MIYLFVQKVAVILNYIYVVQKLTILNCKHITTNKQNKIKQLKGKNKIKKNILNVTPIA